MTNTTMLNDVIFNSGLKVTFTAKKLGLTREGLRKKITNKTEFKASEIQHLQAILNLSDKKRDEIFFYKKSKE